MKKLPIGIQNIREILEENQVYVDKTGFAKELIETGKHYFMSRPRRFGKSLFLNTLEEILKGNKELFQICQIYTSNYYWESYLTLRFDFSQIASHTSKEFDGSMKRALIEKAELHALLIETPTIQEGLKALITQLYNKNGIKVVVLVDEYDHAIINRLNNLETAQGNRDILKDFFTTLKSLDEYLKFTFVTGVSKFSQVSLFSGPNNLTDITMDPRYAGMMGYTEEELRKCFSKHIETISKRRAQEGKNVTEETVLAEMREWYNGYRFSRKPISVYNPYSTLRFLSLGKAESYWYSTGTPSFLIDEVKKHPKSIASVSGISALQSTLSDISKLDRIHLAALMFQTGYLTIQDYNPEEDSYKLGFPNREVKQAFFNSLLQEFTEIEPLEVSRTAEQVRKDLENFDLQSFIDTMNIHFAKIPYHLFTHAKEGFYQTVFFTFLEKSGFKTSAEIATNIGRIDLISETPKVVYLFELKLDKSSDSAFDQVEGKKYKERYLKNGKEIMVLGINFSSISHNISEWKGALFSSSGELMQEFLPKK